MEWELCKENYVPVRQGRKPEVLVSSPVLITKDKAATLQEKRRELWESIEKYVGDDAIEPWLRLIKWTQESFSSGQQKAELQKILELCTRELIKIEKYKTDIRYLRVWVQYADCLPDPNDVFLYLKEQAIGQEYALYYEAYATYLELKGNYAGADACYVEGIQRLARPLERLQQKHNTFQNRMAQRIQRKAHQDGFSAPEQEQAPRVSLAPLAGLRPGTRPLQRLTAPAPTSKSQNIASSALNVFADDLDADSGHAPLPLSSTLRELKPYKQLRKENLCAPSKWAGTTLRTVAASSNVGPKLEIVADEQFEEDVPAVCKADPLSVRRALESAPAAQKNTNQEHGACKLSMGLPFEAPQQLQTGSQQVLSLKADPGDDELSYEELRGEQYLSRTQVINRVPDLAGARAAPTVLKPQPPLGINTSNTSNPAAIVAEPRAAFAPSCAIASFPGPLVDMRGGPTPSTVEGRGAESCMLQGSQPASRTQVYVAKLEPCEDANITMSTKAAFDVINSMFSDEPQQDDVRARKHPEPTVTINTRAAFDAVNLMFNEQLPHESKRACKPKVPRPQVPRSNPQKPLSQSDVCKLANSRRPPAAAFGMYEDTEFITGKVPQQPTVSGSGKRLSLYEDTDYVTKQGSGSSMYEDTEFLDKAHAEPKGLSLYQDTEFLTVGAQKGLKLYEDTEFVGAPSCQPGNARKKPTGSQIPVYEDTEFVARPPVPQKSAGIGIYEDTEFVARQEQLSKNPGLGVYEDTEFVARQALVQKGSGLGMYEDTEFMARQAPLRRNSGLAMYEDTEFVTKRVVSKSFVYEDTDLVN